MFASSAITKFIVLIVALFLSVYLGMTVVTNRTEALGWVGLAAGLAICFALGRNIWLLIPVTMYVNLSFPWLPGGFPPSQIAILVVLGWSALLIAMRKLPLHFTMTHIEFAGVLLLITVIQVYIRNPVGMRVMGSDSVGAKPYFNVGIAVLGAVYLASLRVQPEMLRRAHRWMLAGSVFSFITNTLAFVSPKFASFSGKFLGAWGRITSADFSNTISNTVVDQGVATRIGPAVEGGNLVSRWVCSKRDPVKALINPLWAIVVISACVMAGLSGYRNTLIAVGITLTCGAYYWGGVRSLIGAVLLGIMAYIMLNMVNLASPLPVNIQRALTVLPGTWDERIKEDARQSSEWRVDMWKRALFTDRYIQNKLLGDGLGLTQKEYQFIQTINAGAGLSNEMTQERAMMTQAYHSGPVQTVRVTGYIGLMVLMYTMIVVAVRAHRLIMRAKGTEWFGTVMFLCLHMVWHPIFFFFVFGAFKEDVPYLLMNMGILRLLEKNLPDSVTRGSSYLPYIPLALRKRQDATN